MFANFKYPLFYYILFIIACGNFVSGTISGAFYNFVASRYGQPTAELLARKDLGGGGSFGGGANGFVRYGISGINTYRLLMDSGIFQTTSRNYRSRNYK